MVYCGKPSRGCQMCRTRRIKCDETKPTCLQCQKSRRQCPGYKDDFDLVFRNETQATERRARKSIHSRKVSMQMAGKGLTSPDGTFIMMSDMDIMPRIPEKSSSISYQGHLSIPVEQQAMNYFMANWVLVPKPGQVAVTKGYLDYVIPLIKHEGPNSHLVAAFEAVSIASLGNRPETRMLLGTAWQKYTRALSLVNAALANPTTQKSDQTLASVMLLGHFETITLRRTNIAAWGTHIEGAVMLVKMRGKKQLRTKLGQALFIAVRQIMLINCMSASKSPDLGVEWWVSRDYKDHSFQTLTELIMRVTELRADVNRAMMLLPRTPQNSSKIQDLMRRADTIEAGFQEWLTDVPEDMRYKTVAWMDAAPGHDPGQSDVFPGKVDIYPDLTIAAEWNMYRVARLFLSGIVIRCAAWTCSPVDYRTTPEYASASRLGVDMINDMVASIPYHMGWIGDSGQFKTNPFTGFACGQDDNGQAKVLGAYLLVWPLFTALCSDFTTDAQRKYTAGRLNYMADNLGLAQAAVLITFHLRLPSMIVKRDIAADKMLMMKMRAAGAAGAAGVAQALAKASATPIPASVGQIVQDQVDAALSNATSHQKPGGEPSVNSSYFQGGQSQFSGTSPTSAGGAFHSNVSPISAPMSYFNSMPSQTSPNSQIVTNSAYSYQNTNPSPQGTSEAPNAMFPPPSKGNSMAYSSQHPQFHSQYQGSANPMSFAQPRSFDTSSRSRDLAYDHSSPPPRTQAEDIDDGDEGLKGEAERHEAERLAFKRSFGEVISQVTGKEVADGMYYDKDMQTRDRDAHQFEPRGFNVGARS